MGRLPKRPISVIERRLKSGSIFGTSSKPIPLTEPDRWTIRIINSQISDGHIYDIQAEKGWVYAEPADLAVQPHEVGFREMAGRLVRGDKGSEVLMKMERKDYAAIQKAKDQANRTQTFGKKATQQAILNAAGTGLGDQGASFLERALPSQIEVKDSLVLEPDHE